MGLASRRVAILAALEAGQVPGGRRRRPETPPPQGWSRWLGEPRNAVFLVLASALVFGGGRKLLRSWRGREAVRRLGALEPTAEDIRAAAGHGRSGLVDLFRILGTAESPALRDAAGRALATLWAEDNLITEEEKGLVLRGLAVAWRARRRYPRALRAPIPVSVTYGVPFLGDDGSPIRPENLEWSHRILGARRAALEAYSPWKAGAGRADFTLIPGDFDTNGPHRLVLQARVRTVGLTDAWELELPQSPFTFEFDPLLAPEALFTLADAARGEAIARSVRLEPAVSDEGKPSDYLPLNDDFALRDPPPLRVATPLPCDLAHAIEVELEGHPTRLPAGSLVVSGQGTAPDEAPAFLRFPLGPLAPLPAEAIDRPGTRRIRAILIADPERGWADTDVRSIWPETIATDWVDVQVVRR